MFPLSNNTCQAAILKMMPVLNTHGLDPSWVAPPACEVQEFFDNLSEDFEREESLLIAETTQVDINYIVARVAEVQLAMEAGSAGGMEDEDGTAVEEMELAQWVKAAGKANSANTGAPPIEDVGEEATGGEAESDDPPATGRGRVLRRASSGEPVWPGRAAQGQEVQGESVRLTRATAAKKMAKTVVAKKKAAAYSSSKRPRTPPASPPPTDVDTEVVFDFGSLSPRRKRRAVGEEAEDE